MHAEFSNAHTNTGRGRDRLSRGASKRECVLAYLESTLEHRNKKQKTHTQKNKQFS
jgi:hypothetical protein